MNVTEQLEYIATSQGWLHEHAVSTAKMAIDRIRELEAELARQQDLNGLWQGIQFWKAKCRSMEAERDAAVKQTEVIGSESPCVSGGNYGLCKAHPTCELVRNELVETRRQRQLVVDEASKIAKELTDENEKLEAERDAAVKRAEEADRLARALKNINNEIQEARSQEFTRFFEQRAALESSLRDSQAACAAMRKALQWADDQLKDDRWAMVQWKKWREEQVVPALSSDAGKTLIDELEKQTTKAEVYGNVAEKLAPIIGWDRTQQLADESLSYGMARISRKLLDRLAAAERVCEEASCDPLTASRLNHYLYVWKATFDL